MVVLPDVPVIPITVIASDGLSVHGGGQAAEHRARRRVHQRRHGAGFGASPGGHLGDPGGVGEHRDGTTVDRVAGVPGAVRGRAGQGGEQVTGLHVLGAQRHTGDRHVRNGSAAIRAVGQHRADLSRQLGQPDARRRRWGANQPVPTLSFTPPSTRPHDRP